MGRSVGFAAMFDTYMLEKKTNILEIPNFEAEVLKGMLEYLYSGETEAVDELVTDLLRTSEKYQLLRLKEDCQYALAHNLEFENVAFILVLADMHDASYLKQKTIDFINMNKEELLKNKGFQDAMKGHASTACFLDLLLSQSQ